MAGKGCTCAWPKPGMQPKAKAGTSMPRCPDCGETVQSTARVAKFGRGRNKHSRRPNPKSTPKEIVGSHGHRPHGPSILWPALYEHLRQKGYTKAKSAAISNAAWKKKRVGLKTNTPTSARGIIKSVCPELADDRSTLLLVSNND